MCKFRTKDRKMRAEGSLAALLPAGLLVALLLGVSALAGCRLLGPAPKAAPEAAEAPAAAGPQAGALMRAAESGDLEAAREALEGNPRLLGREDAAGWNAAAYAAWNGHKDVYDYLVAQGADTNVFTEAALGPLQDLVERVRTNPLAVNARDGRQKASPLIWAVRTGNQAAVAFLLDSGAEVDLGDRRGRTALHAAVSAGQLEIARILLYSGARPGARDDQGETPLHLAAEAGDLQFCLALLEAGAPLDAQDDEGNTPLHLAAGTGNFELCEYLLFLGAPADVRNELGLTPGEVADRKGYADVAALLRPREG